MSVSSLLLEAASGFSPWKNPCRLAATVNLVLVGEQVVDGAQGEENDRVLLTAQVEPKENGPWVMKRDGWVRPVDFASEKPATLAATFPVLQGAANSGIWRMQSPVSGDVTPGLVATTWSKIETLDGAPTIGGVGGSGDITAVTVSGALTGGAVSGPANVGLPADAVTNTYLADMATARFKARATAGTGDPEDLTGTQATALLDVALGAPTPTKGLLSGADKSKLDGVATGATNDTAALAAITANDWVTTARIASGAVGSDELAAIVGPAFLGKLTAGAGAVVSSPLVETPTAAASVPLRSAAGGLKAFQFHRVDGDNLFGDTTQAAYLDGTSITARPTGDFSAIPSGDVVLNPTGAVYCGSKRVRSVADPTTAQDAVTLAYLQANASPLVLRTGSVDFAVAQAYADLGAVVTLAASTASVYELTLQADHNVNTGGGIIVSDGGGDTGYLPNNAARVVTVLVWRNASSVAAVVLATGDVMPWNVADVDFQIVDSAGNWKLQVRKDSTTAGTGSAQVRASIRLKGSVPWTGDATPTLKLQAAGGLTNPQATTNQVWDESAKNTLNATTEVEINTALLDLNPTTTTLDGTSCAVVMATAMSTSSPSNTMVGLACNFATSAGNAGNIGNTTGALDIKGNALTCSIGGAISLTNTTGNMTLTSFAQLTVQAQNDALRLFGLDIRCYPTNKALDLYDVGTGLRPIRHVYPTAVTPGTASATTVATASVEANTSGRFVGVLTSRNGSTNSKVWDITFNWNADGTTITVRDFTATANGTTQGTIGSTIAAAAVSGLTFPIQATSASGIRHALRGTYYADA